MADAFYNRGKLIILDSSLALTTDTIQVLLVTSGYTFSDDHNVVTDIPATSHEVTGGGYGRQTLGTKTVTEDDTNNWASFKAANVSFTNVSGTIKAAILFKNGGTDGTSPLIGYIDSGGFPLTISGLAISIAWHANGIILLT